MDPWSCLIIIIFLIIGSFISSGTEMALIASNNHRHYIKVKAEAGSKRAKIVLFLFDKYDAIIIAILISNNIFNVTTGVLLTTLLLDVLGATWGLIASTLITTVFLLIFGEILPKTIAAKQPGRWILNASYLAFLQFILFYPIIAFFRGLILLLRKLSKEQEDDLQFTEDDFQNVVETIEEEGMIDSEEKEIFQAAVEFSETFAKDVLTKRHDIIALDLNLCTHEYLQEFILDHSYSRFPVYKENIDNIVGILHVRSYLKEYFANPQVLVEDTLAKPYYITSQMTLMEIFNGFKIHRTHMALVRSAKGLILGLVTMKDVLEELVSDIDEAGTSPEEEDRNSHLNERNRILGINSDNKPITNSSNQGGDQ